MTTNQTKGRNLASIRSALGLDIAAVARRSRVKLAHVHAAECGDQIHFDRVAIGLLVAAMPRARRGDLAARAALQALLRLLEAA
ncbi:MAG: hypothetical protein IT350_19795 [Deltaproteobacteria bacterium]|nr:hypothetical protein [Deltaproteobacteria bacterium]